MTDTCPRCGVEIDPTKYGHLCKNPQPPAPITREELQEEIANAIHGVLKEHPDFVFEPVSAWQPISPAKDGHFFTFDREKSNC